MATLYKEKLNVTIDLEGVMYFVVVVPHRTSNLAVNAVFATRQEAVMWEPDWDRAHLLCRQLAKHVIGEGVNVKLDRETGSIVPA